MKSSIKTVSCAFFIFLFAFAAEAASLHDQHGVNDQTGDKKWFSLLYQRETSENILALADEKFRNIPPAKIVSLSVDEYGSDPLRLFPVVGTDIIEHFHKKWIGLLFGVRSWNVEDESGFRSISVHSTSAIPLPPTLPLFIGGLAILLLMRLRNRRS